MSKRSAEPQPEPPVFRYASIAEIKIYLIQESELDLLERGAPESLHLNFALALLPVALTLLITLQTATIPSERLYVGYLVAFWATLVQGLVSLARWWRGRRTSRQLFEAIRSRMPPPAIRDVSEAARPS